jgi:hypothetical protein
MTLSSASLIPPTPRGVGLVRGLIRGLVRGLVRGSVRGLVRGLVRGVGLVRGIGLEASDTSSASFIT